MMSGPAAAQVQGFGAPAGPGAANGAGGAQSSAAGAQQQGSGVASLAAQQAQAQANAADDKAAFTPDQIESDKIDGDTSDDPAASARGEGGGRSGSGSGAGEFETYSSQIAHVRLRRFGSSLLVPTARGFTVPPTTTVPPDYRLNPGDEIILGLTGSVEATSLNLVLNSEGRVFVPRVGSITLGGVPYRDLPTVIAQKVANQYNNFAVSVSMGRLHGITVFVTGYAAAPGSYTVSSLSTLINAVLASGGPSSGGSFRSIQVRRQGRLIADFDIYDLLLKGDKSQDIGLQNDDVVFIPPAGPQAAIFGSVNVQAVFEARPGETLADILAYAGGLNTVADDSRLLVFDPLFKEPMGWTQIDPARAPGMALERGQIIQVLSGIGLARSLNRQPVLVTVSGEVANPGRFFLPPNSTLQDALAMAGGMTDHAYPRGTVFTRESVRETQGLSYQQAVQEAQFLLTAQPFITGDSRNRLDSAGVAAVRAVIGQLATANAPDGRLVLALDPTTADLPVTMGLLNGDAVFVPSPPLTVGVFGFVYKPSVFQFAGSGRQTIGDFIERAGGVQTVADPSAIYVVRADGSLIGSKKGLFGRRVLDQPAMVGDMIFVPVDADRGAVWARIGEITNTLFAASLGTLAVSSVTK